MFDRAWVRWWRKTTELQQARSQSRRLSNDNNTENLWEGNIEAGTEYSRNLVERSRKNCREMRSTAVKGDRQIIKLTEKRSKTERLGNNDKSKVATKAKTHGKRVAKNRMANMRIMP